ncbi:hypothetical protein [Tessaracoccus palaemonis]|uniref:SPOR domain-containing protein n=1 Tax=Tessaracoccus palaemonis TaxID=2829499 RepID=A0ABX8SKI0_9ACTN|nr:hypothetical protein [Tessaracoccus palaemonis]QXT63851.1 hypothetical protein KDB89_05135 [Tessaracoccus palaemonis]
MKTRRRKARHIPRATVCLPRALRLRLLAVAAAVAVVLGGCVPNAESRGRLDLVEAYTTQTDPDWPYLDASDETSSVCGNVTNCVQAVGNQYLVLLKFGTVAEAAEYAATLGDAGYQVDPLVIHFNGTQLPVDVRRDVISSVEQINADSPD